MLSFTDMATNTVSIIILIEPNMRICVLVQR